MIEFMIFMDMFINFCKDRNIIMVFGNVMYYFLN